MRSNLRIGARVSKKNSLSREELIELAKRNRMAALRHPSADAELLVMWLEANDTSLPRLTKRLEALEANPALPLLLLEGGQIDDPLLYGMWRIRAQIADQEIRQAVERLAPIVAIRWAYLCCKAAWPVFKNQLFASSLRMTEKKEVNQFAITVLQAADLYTTTGSLESHRLQPLDKAWFALQQYSYYNGQPFAYLGVEVMRVATDMSLGQDFLTSARFACILACCHNTQGWEYQKRAAESKDMALHLLAQAKEEMAERI